MGLEVFDGYHNKASDGHPAVDESKLTLYGNIICPFVRRVLLILSQKSIPYNFVGIDLQDKPEWYLAMYPPGKVPYLKHGDKYLPESLVIVNYLDQLYPPSIHPVDPYEKAQGSLIIDELVNPNITVIVRCLKDHSLPVEEKIKIIDESCASVESILVKIKSKFLQDNEKPLYSDYMTFPFMEAIVPIAQLFSHPTIKSDEALASHYPLIGRYMQAMKADPDVAKISPTYDTFKAYFEKVYTGSK